MGWGSKPIADQTQKEFERTHRADLVEQARQRAEKAQAERDAQRGRR